MPLTTRSHNAADAPWIIHRPTSLAAPPTLGMELDLQIVDRSTRALVDVSRWLLPACADEGVDRRRR